MTASRVNTCSLSAEQIRTYKEEGIVHLPGAVPRADADAMADALWSELARKHGIHRGRPETWPAGLVHHLQAVARSGAFAPMASPLVRGAIDHALGERGWEEPHHWGLPLVTFPNTDKSWDVPHRTWHLDVAAQAGTPHPVVTRLFVLLADLEPGGGGTLFAAGSHRLVQRLANASPSGSVRSAKAREALKVAYPLFAALCSEADEPGRVQRFMGQETDVEGGRVRVREMTGKAGDALLMHPYMLHTLSDNVRGTPRLALTHHCEPAGNRRP